MKIISTKNLILNDNKNACGSCTIYTVFFAIAFLIIIGISSGFKKICFSRR